MRPLLLWLRSPLLGLGCLLLWPLSSLAAIQVVASIKPLHSLVAGVMQGVGEPILLVQGGASPHDYSLRPSEVRAINQAQVVFWIGPALESFLVKPLENEKAKVKAVALFSAPGVERLPLREGGAWEAHDDQDVQGHEHEASYDAHIWLDPVNARAIVRQIVTVLSEVDAAHRTEYEKNGAQLLEQLARLNQQLAQELLTVKDRPYMVFHDAYQYFERRYQLRAVGSVVLHPEQRPGAKRVGEIRTRIRELGVRCVFSEPQFQPTLVATVIEGSGAHRGTLDPLGAELTADSALYFKLLQALTANLKACLSSG